jgi:NAD(P)-dependent dehydrogenase (short-subunit alcohol dehydrogenase family)
MEKPVAVIVGATTKWRRDGHMTKLIHGAEIDDSAFPPSVRYGVGGAIALKFAREGFHTVLTTRDASNASGLLGVIREAGGTCSVVEMDLADDASIASAFRTIRDGQGDPEVLVYNAGYPDGRELPKEMELLENMPVAIFDTAMAVSCRGPFLVAKEVLPAMRRAGRGTFLFSNNAASLRGRKRHTGESLYYPRTMMRTLAQVLTEEYSEHGVHVANVVIDGLIDSPGTRALKRAQDRPDMVINPEKIAEAFWHLHAQDPSCWTHEIQLTPYPQRPSY